MKSTERRNIHQKEKFLEGNRQRWLVVFLFCGALILGMDAAQLIHKVDSYLTFLTFLSGAFILGYSGTETMKLFRVSSESQNIDQEKREFITEEKHLSVDVKYENLTHNAKDEDYKL